MKRLMKTVLLFAVAVALLMLSACAGDFNKKAACYQKLTVNGNIADMQKSVSKTLDALNLEFLYATDRHNTVTYTSLDERVKMPFGKIMSGDTIDELNVFAADKDDPDKVIAFFTYRNSFRFAPRPGNFIVSGFVNVSDWDPGEISFAEKLFIGQTKREVLASCGEPRQKGYDSNGNYAFQYGRLAEDDALFSVESPDGVKTNFFMGDFAIDSYINAVFDGSDDDAKVIVLLYRFDLK